MSKFSARCAAMVISVAILLATATVSYAKPAEWSDIVVTLQTSDAGQSELVVRAELPPDTALPYEGELAVPAGTALRWMGEILGGPLSEDPTVQYTKTTDDGMDVYRFTLRQARIAQFEGNIQGAWTTQGTTRTTALSYTPLRDVKTLIIRERLPQGAQIVQAGDDAELVTSENDWTFYAKTVKKVKAGDVVDLTYSYSVPAPVASAPPATGSDDSAGLIVVVAVVAMGAGMILTALFMGGLKKSSGQPNAVPRRAIAKSSEADDADEDDCYEDEDEDDCYEDEDEDEDEEEAFDEEDEPGAAASQRRAMASGPKVAVGVVMLALVAGVAFAISVANSVPVVDGKMTKFFGSTSACSAVSVPITPADGVSITQAGSRILKAFQGKDGIGDVTVDVSRSVVDVEFCVSSQTEAGVRQIIAGTGAVSGP